MNRLVSRLFRALLALSAAVVVAANPSFATPTAPGLGPTTRILAIGSMTPKFTPAARQAYFQEEVRDTIGLYLQGKIADWYSRNDKLGVVFVLNTSDPKEAHDLLDHLPFGREGLMEFELIPVGPLQPLGLMLGQAKQ